MYTGNRSWYDVITTKQPKGAIFMYQNYTIGQTEFVLNYNYDLPQNHIARLISDFVDSIPQDVLLEDSGPFIASSNYA